MAGEKSDRRVKYTKMMLRQSLLELMKDRPVSKITVKDICALADINRGTFYAHYADPEDLLRQIENELYEEILRSLDGAIRADTVPKVLLEIFTAIERNGDLCRSLFSETGDKAFLRRIIDLAHDRCLAAWTAQFPQADRRQLEMIYIFSANGSVGIIQEWIQGGMRESPQTVADFLDKISFYGVQAFWDEDNGARA